MRCSAASVLASELFHVKHYDVVVVGGGHAGTEAAAAAARRGAAVLLITQRIDQIGVMSCNPSIGGVGKGHLVREVDALDGLMARAADDAAIHHRMLNRSKGLAVQGPRIQADRRLYRSSIQAQLRTYPTLRVIEDEVVGLDIGSGRVRGVHTEGATFETTAVVLATGTFLGGRLFRGTERLDGGRIDEAPSKHLSDQLRSLGLPIARLKTGTPPRLDGRTIDWARLERQPSDAETWQMSFLPRETLSPPQLACAITRTGELSHDIIRAGLTDSPLFAGAITGGGPRYCPSIEDKVHRFGDRDGHQVFLEPEGLDDHTVYPNGISTSLSRETQDRLIASIAGLEQTEIITYGYAVEYDYLDPRSLDHRLALHVLPGLFCAGQINGSTGYEEAAAQGLVAGANAAAHALSLDPFLLDRAAGYIGVMVDDLVLQGVSEPYRMLTARAEYRLALRPDNAESRLTGRGVQAELVRELRRGSYRRRQEMRARARDGQMEHVDADIRREVEEDARYAPYLERQASEVARMRTDGDIAVPPPELLHAVPGLSTEMIERLRAARPKTLDQASRVRGVTPAALSALWLHARKTA
ncbi:tRNA uridine-5-carboxymethylaminomethyl(34) synthesis enzyme MnmG [Sphingomonas yunnanensis]|uniref:tRNA uridine-5-carboxymethylaminomethyl(34) synthesis enzyme MnmG n=1 Tax=Sphingomonas yunnanensis TaxID=310400 RepID=UPI001CA69606|nr:tRNA uridine-5-carboxymethylaminomethyl(34) synthesis enzyme MnmG [Sphingomonas yunnanensis]MBY9065007.1 tRNA uridine-5-carboxymethylaminomethyl(34) synthesis enzyme MnmG [Sphingomonas yunnanensis]